MNLNCILKEIRLEEINCGGVTTWYYRVGGIFKEGWYYFFPKGKDSFMFDPKYSPSSWIRINNKWYDFNNGGKWYWFDSNGYMIQEFNSRPNIESLKES